MVSTLEWFSGVVPDLPTVYFYIHITDRIDRQEVGVSLILKNIFFLIVFHFTCSGWTLSQMPHYLF